MAMTRIVIATLQRAAGPLAPGTYLLGYDDATAGDGLVALANADGWDGRRDTITWDAGDELVWRARMAGGWQIQGDVRLHHDDNNGGAAAHAAAPRHEPPARAGEEDAMPGATTGAAGRAADARAVLLLALPLGGTPGGPDPLSPAEYDALARALHARGARPGALLGPEGRALIRGLGRDPARLAALLGRGAILDLSLARWASARIWVISRADDAYPGALRRLGPAAPAVLFGAGDPGRLARLDRLPDPSAIPAGEPAGPGGWVAALVGAARRHGGVVVVDTPLARLVSLRPLRAALGDGAGQGDLTLVSSAGPC